MIPRMQQQVFRAEYGDGRLLGDKLRQLERGCDNLIAPALHDARHETHLLRLCCREVASCKCELVHEALVPCEFREAGECPDVGCEANVYFLFKVSRSA